MVNTGLLRAYNRISISPDKYPSTSSTHHLETRGHQLKVTYKRIVGDSPSSQRIQADEPRSARYIYVIQLSSQPGQCVSQHTELVHSPS